MEHTNHRAGLLAAGNWIIDHVKIIDRFPEQDTLASILSRSRGTGGSPYNVLVGLAKLGAAFPLEAVALPLMRALVAATQESVALHVRSGAQRLCLLRVDAR